MQLNINTFNSLKYRDFRLYFIGQCISLIGTWMQQIAMSWLLYNLTGSIAMLGAIFFISQAPILLITPFSSAFIDKVNKRKILIITQGASMLHAIILTILTLTNTIEVWQLVLLSFFLGIINAIDMPTRQAYYTSLVPKENLTNAVALNSAIINGARLIGPAIGGVIVGLVGEGGCFLVNSISYIFVIIALFMIKSEQIIINQNKTRVVEDIKDGYKYMKKHVPIKVLILTTLIFCFLIFPITTFIPAFTKDVLGGNSEKLGLILSVVGVGSFISAMFLASRKGLLGLEKLQLAAIFVSSIISIFYFFVTSLWITLILSAILGFSMVCTIATTNTMLQALTDLNMKGRIMGYYTMCFLGGSALGSLLLGWLSKVFTLPYTMAASGVICVIGIIIYLPYLERVTQQTKDKYIENGIIPEIPV